VVFHKQSGVEIDRVEATTTAMANIKLEGIGNTCDVAYESSYDETRSIVEDSKSLDLNNFFARPVRLQYDWTVGSPLFEQFNPWEVFFSDKRVNNRINNYNLLSCDLNAKIMINGNVNMAGAFAMIWHPLAQFDSLTLNRGLYPQDFIQMSQMEKVICDARTSAGGTIKMPMFWHRNKLNIPQGDWSNMGLMTLRSINTLKQKDNLPIPIRITVLIWAENVELSVLTSENNVDIVPQSGLSPVKEESEQDEANAKGIVSGPATAVAKAAGILSRIPTIAPYMRATSAAASLTAAIAKRMGYSSPPVTRSVEPYRPTTTNDYSTCTTPKFVRKLTVDDKQELTVDPRISSVGEVDELNIARIASRESYLTTFNWDITDPTDKLLWNCRVLPSIWDESTATASPALHLPACCAAGLPFTYWSGTMVYRFQVIKNGFHRGRLKIVYDPNYISGTEYNVNEIKIVDIVSETDFTLEIGMAQDKTYLTQLSPGLDGRTEAFSTTEYTVKEPASNGVLGVYVMNDLLPTNNDGVANLVEINVYVSMKDAKFQAPDSDIGRYVFKTQSGLVLKKQSGLVSENEHSEAMKYKPDRSPSTILAAHPKYSDNTDLVYFGESIDSFKKLLHRYCLHALLTESGSSASQILYGTRPMFPYLRGRVAGAVDTAGVDAYNLCNTMLLHFVVNMFQGWRGSIRWSLFNWSDQTNSRTSFLSIERQEANTGLSYRNGVETVNTNLFLNDLRKEVINDAITGTTKAPALGYTGMTIENNLINTCMDFECPFYSNDRFIPGKVENYMDEDLNLEKFRFRFGTHGDTTSRLYSYAAAGEDFQTYCFTGLPPIYLELTPP
jgi:hypothetical protein